jgi:hypothetical protein
MQGWYSLSTQTALNDEEHAYNVIEPIHQNSVRQKRDVKLFWEEKDELIF